MSDRVESLEVLIENLKNVRVNEDQLAEFRMMREKCDKAFLPFAESELQFVDNENMDEAGAHIVALHREAFTLREQFDSLLRSNKLENSETTSSAQILKDAFLECCARVENIYSLRRPDLMRAVDAVL